MAKRRIGILTSGGDCPGLNATIRGVAKACYNELGEDKVEIIRRLSRAYTQRVSGNEAVGFFRNTDSGRHNIGYAQDSL